MKTREEMKEMFLKFLKDENFHDEWMEAYNLDNEMFENDKDLDHFFKYETIEQWVKSVCESIKFLGSEFGVILDFGDCQTRIDNWCNRNLSRVQELDEKWWSVVKGQRELTDGSQHYLPPRMETAANRWHR